MKNVRYHKELLMAMGLKMKHVTQKRFERSKRKPRIAKKMADRLNRNRNFLFYCLRVNFVPVRSEAEHRLIKADARRCLAGVPHNRLRRLFDLLLPHRRYGYQASVISYQIGRVRRIMVINRKDLTYWCDRLMVVNVTHADGTREVYAE